LSSSKIREIQGENSTISVNFPHTASQQLARISENLRKKSLATIVVTIGRGGFIEIPQQRKDLKQQSRQLEEVTQYMEEAIDAS